MLRQVATPAGDAAPAEPEGLLIPLCPECGSYYLFPVYTPEGAGYIDSHWPQLADGVDLGKLYTCLPCGWIGNRPHYGI
jgi:hypothetical protein